VIFICVKNSISFTELCVVDDVEMITVEVKEMDINMGGKL
jgi:hypothetical protein